MPASLKKPYNLTTKIRISSKVQIFNFSNLPSGITKEIKEYLTIPNKDFHMLIAQGVRSAKRNFLYYTHDKESDTLIAPRGAAAKIYRIIYSHPTFQNSKFKIPITKDLVGEEIYEVNGSKTREDKNLEIDKDYFKNLKLTASPRPAQEQIIKATRKKQNNIGMLVADTGIGKTFAAINIMKEIGLPATVIVHLNSLVEQWKREILKFTNLKESDIGILNGEKKEIKPITIATTQTLRSRPVLAGRLAAQTAVLFVDELHLHISKKRLGVLQRFKPWHLYGLTGTPRRSDGKTKALEFVFGRRLCEVNQDKLSPKVEVHKVNSEIIISEYPEMISDLVESKKRNDILRKLITFELVSGRKILVLTKRIKHGEILKSFWENNDLFMHIKADDDDRDEVLNKLKENNIDFRCLFGTFQLLGTGIDIPSLDTLIIASDLRSTVLTQQGAGRILRLFDKKKTPKIIDVADFDNRILRSQFWDRYNFYKEQDWEVEFLG